MHQLTLMQQKQDMVTNNFRYKIYPISQLNSIDWSLFEHSPETCRKSVDGSEFVVRFKNTPPQGVITLSHSETKSLMSTLKWYINED